MFLFDPTFGSSFESCEAEVRRLMERVDAEIVFCRKWDERRLAYRIKGRKRGVYVLVYFKAEPNKIVPLERDVQLAENILRVLILRADGVTPEMMEWAVAHPGAEVTISGGGGEASEDSEGAAAVEAKPSTAAVETTVEVESAPAATDVAVADEPGDGGPSPDDESARTAD
jgi:small subunit ribosomal protein S6